MSQLSAVTVASLRLRVTAEADPGAIARVLERFVNLNILPYRVVAEFGTTNTLHIQVDSAGLSESALAGIATKLGQHPCVLNAYWCRI